MAKLVITIEDLPEGGVGCVCSPSAESLLLKHNNTIDGLSSAEAYALFVLNQLRDEAKRQKEEQTGIIIPGVHRPNRLT